MTDRKMFTCLCYAVDHSCTYKMLSYFIHVYLPTISFISPPPPHNYFSKSHLRVFVCVCHPFNKKV